MSLYQQRGSVHFNDVTLTVQAAEEKGGADAALAPPRGSSRRFFSRQWHTGGVKKISGRA